ncbi:MAG: pyruvoyl-dependent arginine decarboxylase [Ignavibacteriales bacterium]
MLPTPNTFSLATGHSEGGTPLTAFDAALLEAGLGNLNLLKVSSVIPPGARPAPVPRIPPGSLVPVAYGSITSTIEGEIISAGVAVALSRDTFGMIMEYSGRCPRHETEAVLEEMVRESFEKRGLGIDAIMVESVEHRVIRCGCAFAAVALWHD